MQNPQPMSPLYRLGALALMLAAIPLVTFAAIFPFMVLSHDAGEWLIVPGVVLLATGIRNAYKSIWAERLQPIKVGTVATAQA